jgi:hypothetical protein
MENPVELQKRLNAIREAKRILVGIRDTPQKKSIAKALSANKAGRPRVYLEEICKIEGCFLPRHKQNGMCKMHLNKHTWQMQKLKWERMGVAIGHTKIDWKTIIAGQVRKRKVPNEPS